jgi:HD-like signal output (HDOD) protein
MPGFYLLVRVLCNLNGAVKPKVSGFAAVTSTMQEERLAPAEAGENAALVRTLMDRCLADDALAVPRLPDVAVRVVRIGAKESTNAEQLAVIIDGDAALSRVVLRIAASAANRPVMPITSLQHAVAWLGFNEVANIGFTLALQARLLHVPGLQDKARRLWRHALASALWSRQLAQLLGVETGPSYLCGLLHNIGKIVTLGALYDIGRNEGRRLNAEQYEQLIETFHREVGIRVITAWQLPSPVLSVSTQWEDYAAAGEARFAANIVNVAHRLADFTTTDPTLRARERVVTAPSYRDLGPRLEDHASLFDVADDIKAELDRYLSP